MAVMPPSNHLEPLFVNTLFDYTINLTRIDYNSDTEQVCIL
jgi:hypothetical protein